jgi:DNA adenine methylase
MKKPLVAFSYYGGKASHLKWLLPLLPPTRQYCEPFGGSAAVLLNKPRSPVEIYNDLDSEIVNFFRVLREKPDDLVRQISLTPYSREEFANALKYEGDSELERARKFYVRIAQARSGLPNVSAGQWSFQATGTSKTSIFTRASFEKNGNFCLALMKVASRLKPVCFENRAALEVIDLYDHPETLIYCDPPYDPTVCQPAYKFNMTVGQLDELAGRLKDCKSKVAFAGYSSPTLEKRFKGWKRIGVPVNASAGAGVGKGTAARTEVLWCNYELRRLF